MEFCKPLLKCQILSAKYAFQIRHFLFQADIYLDYLESAEKLFEEEIRGKYSQDYDNLAKFIITIRKWAGFEKKAEFEIAAIADETDSEGLFIAITHTFNR